ncbi:Flp family type IVb pilin [Thermoflexus hugenholtzii]
MISGGGALMRNRIREWGQGLVEYGLILLLIALVVLVALTVFGQSVSSLYSRVVSSWP